MFNKNFYPTPSSVIQNEILRDISISDLRNKLILEPHGGKGDILDYIHERISNEYVYYKDEAIRSNLHTIEIDPNLQAILLDKKYVLIGDDFLTTPISYHYDYIFMNPPFDNGAEHLLKAWDILNCGTIRCLLNAETYNNPYTQKRKDLKAIIDKHGSVRNIGAAFKRSERPTNVDIVIVELSKVSESKLDLDVDLDIHGDDVLPDDISPDNSVAVYNSLKAKEARVKADIEAFKQLLIARKRYDKSTNRAGYLKRVLAGEYNQELNTYIKALTKESWNKLLEESKFSEYLTKRVKDEFISKQFPLQQNIAFSYPNMLKLLDVLISNSGTIIDRCILDSFDLLTKYHKDNRVHVEGWKTNDVYKVNKKFILPYVLTELTPYNSSFRLSWQHKHILKDLDMVLCYLSGIKMYTFNNGNKKCNIISTHRALQAAFDHDNDHTNPTSLGCAQSTFFDLKYYKKGTIHFKFRDSQLWQFFNCRASELRGYPLPEATKVYKEAKNQLLKLL